MNAYTRHSYLPRMRLESDGRWTKKRNAIFPT